MDALGRNRWWWDRSGLPCSPAIESLCDSTGHSCHLAIALEDRGVLIEHILLPGMHGQIVEVVGDVGS